VAVSLNDDTATLSGGYTYSLTATSITPSTGPVAGGTNVTIAGSNFPADFVPGGAETKTLTSTTNYITSQVYGGKLYMPGESGNKLVIYDVAADTTTTKTLPNNMNRYTAQIYNGKLYMPENNGTKLEVYDIATGTTETRYTLNTMDRVTSQLYGGKLYMPERNGNQLAIYNITAGGYNNTVITLPNNMYHSTSQVYNGKLYMPENNGTKLEIYDIATNTTTTETLLNTMFRLTSQLSGGKLYMPGGTNNKLEIYDIATGTTETKTLPNSMLRNTSQLYNGKIYMPEYDGNKLEIYDITTGTTITKTLPNSMERWASDLYDGKLYMSEPGSDQLEIFDLRELSVSFDGVPATNIAVVSSTTLTAITPAHAAGVVDVTVSLNGQLATLSGGYTYIPPLAVNSVTPNHGLELGGTSVTVIGTGFIPLPPPTPTTMQEMTQAFCANMTVYTGSNPAAILTLNDPRGAGQQYQIAKLADNNCWMLNNLKLGSTSGTLALTPADTNIATNRTMPQVRGPSDFSSAMDTPWAASVPGDSSSITANNFYGYHYNWCAATGGDPATCTASGTEPPNATQDICPANWRLPTGGPSGEFAWLNAKMNNVNASAPSTAGGTGYYQNWLNSGRFKGVFSGHGSGGAPNTVGTVGRLWSSTPYNANNVYYLSIEATTVNPANNVSRSVRTAMRCITPGGTAPEPVVEFDGVAATVTAWDETSITVTVPAHAAGLVDVTVNNGAESVTMPATCSTATATDCNGRLDSGETRHSDRANVTSGFLYEEVYLSLSTGTGTVNVGGITPTSGGAYGTSSNLLTTTTNNTTGYSLSISTNQPGANPNSKDLKHLTLNEYITGTANTCSWNTGAGTLTNTTNALVNNTWGFTLNTVNRDNQQLCQVPNSDSPLTIKATNTANESGDNTSVHYGARVSTSKVSGTYQGVIRYVVVARP
jgi:uncharacterized protein (TIGR02145 family)